ncbi:hypothetical protein DDF67_16250 [Caulobacter endophyticus]|uniref:DUF2059 domain-containing protein n=2 Tax=Caulobacter endophyticus TaxID=2172652 RepID=A0A2T9JS37_9CAUL|nr:hypothetical protein DDF67_16250 [Caulobacter endophyticus]
MGLAPSVLCIHWCGCIEGLAIMKRIVAAVAAFSIVLGAAGPSAASSPRARELAHRYVSAMDMKKNFAPMLDNLMAGMLQQQMASAKGDDEAKALVGKAVREAFNESVEAGMLDRMMAAMEPAIAESFSEDELQAMVDFYESPTGRSIIAKMPSFGVKSSAAVVAIMPEMQADLERRLLAKLAALKSQKEK